MSAESQKQWLVRSARNQISGPFTREQVRELIEQGKLELGDEVCNANVYWFYLHEAEEVRGQLGIEIPQQLYARNSEEGTDTQTDTSSLDRTDPEVAATRMAPSPRSQNRAPEPSLPDLPELEGSLDEIGENTAVMSNRAFRDYRHKKPALSVPHVTAPMTPASAPSQAQAHPPTHVQSHAAPVPRRAISVERSKALQILAYIMMVGAVVLVIAVIKLLQQSPV